MDEYGRFDLTGAERQRLRAIWQSPEDGELLRKVRAQMMAGFEQMNRTCALELVPIVRGQLDVLDQFFSILEDTVDPEYVTRWMKEQAQKGVPPAI